MNTSTSKSFFEIQGSGFADLRQRAFAFLQEIEIPNRKSEEYKYTPIAQVLQKNFPELSSSKFSHTSSLISIDQLNLPTFDCYILVLVNGSFKPELSTLPESLEITDLNESNPQISELLSSAALADDNFFVALNTIQFNEGLSINVPKSKTIDKPVSIINIIDSAEQMCFCSPRIIITLNEDSQISFYEFNIC